MRLLRGIINGAIPQSGVVATIGNFDGVHLGHQALLDALKAKAHAQNLPTLVVLFEPQPHEYFNADAHVPRLTPFKEKWRILNKLGIDYIYCLRFNAKLASKPAGEFARLVIFDSLNIKHLIIGKDFCFGKGRQGNLNLLQQVAPRYNATVSVHDDVLYEQNRVSSTQIRALLGEYALKQASLRLGRLYSISGRVVLGQQLGRTFGVPTANIPVTHKMLPMTGVFCVSAKRASGESYLGVANLGRRPTVDGLKNRLEVHLFDFEGSLYGETLEVSFLHHLREEIKFSSFDALIAQIKTDILEARALMPRLINDFSVRVSV